MSSLKGLKPPQTSWLDVDPNGDDSSLATPRGSIIGGIPSSQRAAGGGDNVRFKSAAAQQRAYQQGHGGGPGSGGGVSVTASSSARGENPFEDSKRYGGANTSTWELTGANGPRRLGDKGSAAAGGGLGGQWWRRVSRRTWIIIGASVLLVVIIIAVVGGVVGSQSKGSSSSGNSSGNSSGGGASTGKPSGTATATATTSSSSSPTASVTLQALRSRSRIAATGWRGNMDFNVRLFYQDADNNLRFSSFSSITGSWLSSSKVNNGAVFPEGAALAAGTVVSILPPQVEVHWLDSSLTKLDGQKFRDGDTPFAGTGTTSPDVRATLRNTTRLAIYWPLALAQNDSDDGKLSVIAYQDGTGGVVAQTLGVDSRASAGTGLGMVPMMGHHDDDSGHVTGALYRDTNGNLAGFKASYNAAKTQWSTASWDMGKTTVPIPDNSPFAAFAVADISNATGPSLIYLVYQDPDSKSKLKYASYTAADGWKTSSSSVLSNADDGTDVACVTEAASGGGRTLSPQRDLSRCYFMSGGRMKEVWFDGNDWKDMGSVPLS